MKKRLLPLLLISSLLICLLPGCAEKTVSYKEHLDDYVQTMPYKDGFTILQLTDIHWSSASPVGDESFGSEAYIRKVVAEAVAHAGHVDLIEVTGDTFMLTDKRAVRQFIDMMTDLGIPYAMVWGNHDRESTYNPNWISKQFLSAPHSLYLEVDHDDVHERGNYVINLENPDGSVAWQIINLDSGASYREGAGDLGLTYDYIRDDQFAWMSAEHKAAGEDVPALCYYHIAQADQQAVFDAIEGGDTSYKSKFFKLEGFAPSAYAVSTEQIFADNNVKGAFCGHAHANDWTYTTPGGIVYGLGVKTCPELYYGNVPAGYEGAGFEVTEDFILIGASLVTLNDASGDFTLEHLYLNERDGGDLVMWVKY